MQTITKYHEKNFEVICPECQHENLYLHNDGGELLCAECGYCIVEQISENEFKIAIGRNNSGVAAGRMS